MKEPLTKSDELTAVRILAEQLGPDSYLGPWLQGALPYLEDSLITDIYPVPALQLHQQAAADRIQGLLSKQNAQAEARDIMESAHKKADELLQQARVEADRITGRAWQALRLAMKELES